MQQQRPSTAKEEKEIKTEKPKERWGGFVRVKMEKSTPKKKRDVPIRKNQGERLFEKDTQSKNCKRKNKYTNSVKDSVS